MGQKGARYKLEEKLFYIGLSSENMGFGMIRFDNGLSALK